MHKLTLNHIAARASCFKADLRQLRLAKTRVGNHNILREF
jgi:hypothetical protein